MYIHGCVFCVYKYILILVLANVLVHVHLLQEVYHGQVSSEQEPLQHKMAHMHPLLTEGLEE